jgi:hypothetical protein
MSPEGVRQEGPTKEVTESPEIPIGIDQIVAEIATIEGWEGKNWYQYSIPIGKTAKGEAIYFDSRFLNLKPESFKLLGGLTLSECLQMCLGAEKEYSVLVQPSSEELGQIMIDKGIIEKIRQTIKDQLETNIFESLRKAVGMYNRDWKEEDIMRVLAKATKGFPSGAADHIWNAIKDRTITEGTSNEGLTGKLNETRYLKPLEPKE